ncbi:MAG: efflux RND transporter permease subunit, partial [Bacteroidota bacterium]
MKISDYAVKNYQFTLVLFLMVVALGIVTILTMPRAEDPELRTPQFPIIAVFPGTSPKDMEDLVAEPLEREISQLENIKRMVTNISDGVVVMFVEYDFDSDVDEKYAELLREVNALRAELPANLSSLEVR